MFKNNRGFTLIEMLIVLMIISVLIILIVPNLGDKSADVNDTGCEALAKMVESQVALYQLEEGSLPDDLNDLVDQYITEDQTSCSNGALVLNADGTVSVPGEAPAQ
nr:competence type IV pilus major pilin ComGC [Lentibacillus sediminis]